MKHRDPSTRGFTLIEVSIVVVIVAVLAVVGIVGYRRYRSAARMGEATTMLNAIRIGQAEYKAEVGTYANVSKSLNDYHPAEQPGKFATQWGPDCTSCKTKNGWEAIKVRSPDPVVFGYSTVAGIGGYTSGVLGPSMGDIDSAIAQQNGVLKATDPFFLAMAASDMDGDGVTCNVLGLSHTNHLVVVNEGE